MTRYIQFKRSFEHITWEAADLSLGGNAFLPSTALVPLAQHVGAPAVPVVSPGEPVREGQLIARGSAPDSVNIHAPIPGILAEYRMVPLPDGTIGQAAVINLSGSFDILGRKEEHFQWKFAPESEILRVIEEKGVINTFDAPVSLIGQLRSARKRGNAVMALRLFDSDPTCQLDSFLSRNFLSEVLEGTALLAKGMDCHTICLVHEGKQWSRPSKSEVESLFGDRKVLFLAGSTRYPSGNARQASALIASCAALPAEASRTDPVLVDAVTALSAYDAVVRNQPVMNRYLTVTGPALDSPAILKVRIGTPIGDVIEECGGFKQDPRRIVVNGLLLGTAVHDLDTPITKYTKSLHIMDADTCPSYAVRDCIHCGRCLQVCPVKIDPMRVAGAIMREKRTKGLAASISACQYCGCCAIVCPSRIPLHHIIREAASRKKGVTE